MSSSVYPTLFNNRKEPIPEQNENEVLNMIYKKAEEILYLQQEFINSKKNQLQSLEKQLEENKLKQQETTDSIRKSLEWQRKSNENLELKTKLGDAVSYEINQKKLFKTKLEIKEKDLNKEYQKYQYEISRFNQQLIKHFCIMRELSLISFISCKRSLYTESIEIFYEKNYIEQSSNENAMSDESHKPCFEKRLFETCKSSNKSNPSKKVEVTNQLTQPSFQKKKFEIPHSSSNKASPPIPLKQTNKSNHPPLPPKVRVSNQERELTPLQKEIIKKNTTTLDKIVNVFSEDTIRKGLKIYTDVSKQVNDTGATPYVRTVTHTIGKVTDVAKEIPIIRRVAKPLHYCVKTLEGGSIALQHEQDVNEYLDNYIAEYRKIESGGGTAYAISQTTIKTTCSVCENILFPMFVPFYD
ncbi:hypothetical protein EDI_092290 [Entamoeba dispar SAW760]|uniref:Uncharacterized protein n=1 Tax=Entamoeba dispar (strain ATCC PRA-260 / SAW760) TaxID=370354 RepID=B0ED21_ENTDS|nr:uncharacterized protein EDI_092290 [Entamoeba dispar SAW760]EDR27438.1 hypothetical protein EDI_092290 [Entamoeba dispar SAW760]|eukprot:EDR27438.1 hypothetical protein EDI_092290 [Entamoeba dispar SAW760]